MKVTAIANRVRTRQEISGFVTTHACLNRPFGAGRAADTDEHPVSVDPTLFTGLLNDLLDASRIGTCHLTLRAEYTPTLSPVEGDGQGDVEDDRIHNDACDVQLASQVGRL